MKKGAACRPLLGDGLGLGKDRPDEPRQAGQQAAAGSDRREWRQSVKRKDMTKANVKFVCGLIFSLTIMCLAGNNFQEGKYGLFVLDMITIIPWVYLMISGYKDLPEK